MLGKYKMNDVKDVKKKERCEHEWIPRKKKETPVICPECKSPYWNKPKKK